MYEVLRMDRCAMTNFMDLRNLETGMVEKNCFDYTKMISNKNFDFMQEGGIYDCKLQLFGEFVDKDAQDAVPVRILESNVRVGNALFFKVAIRDDIYYIYMPDAEGVELQPVMYYDYTRVDLIQVDDVIHPD